MTLILRRQFQKGEIGISKADDHARKTHESELGGRIHGTFIRSRTQPFGACLV